MQSISYISTDSFHLQQLQWKSHKPHTFFLKPIHNKPQILTFSHSLSTSPSSGETNNENRASTFHLPIEIQNGNKASRYYWNGTQLQLLPIDENPSTGFSLDDGFEKFCNFCTSTLRNFLIPNQVQDNYIEYVKWKFLHRVFSSALQVLATQAMFRAMGFGFSRSLSSAAALNWVLKDGLGRLSRCVYTACLASAFDTKLKTVRFLTSIMFSLSIGVELLTPFFPRHFLLTATVANIAKQISLACYISTRSAVHRSFAVAGNLCEISAKAQIQTVCFDSLGLILATVLNILCKNDPRLQAGLPLVLYPVFSAFDLFGIYQGLKHVHLQTLTKDRLEIILETWIQSGSIPSPSKVSKEEGIDFPWCKGRRRWSIRIGCINPKDPMSRFSMLTMRSLRRDELYFICMEASNSVYTGSWQAGLLLSLHKEADIKDIIVGLLQACYMRRMLLEKETSWEHILDANDVLESDLREWFELVDESKRLADREVNLLKEIGTCGWADENILLSTEEQVAYKFLVE